MNMGTAQVHVRAPHNEKPKEVLRTWTYIPSELKEKGVLGFWQGGNLWKGGQEKCGEEGLCG